MTSDNRAEPGGPQLFTASDIARFCQVDLKTIHNWSDKGEILHFRTPGRHLRFRRVDVLEFLRKYGYPIPPALRDGKPRVMVVDEDPHTLGMMRRALSKRFDTAAFEDPFEALVQLGTVQPDILVLDPTMTSLDGFRLIERLKTISSTSHIRVIALVSDESRRQQLASAGVVALVAKNSTSELRETLERLTGIERNAAVLAVDQRPSAYARTALTIASASRCR